MESHVTGGTAPLSLGELRQYILAALIGNPLFTKEEQLRANHFTHECECPQRLVLWLHNVQRESERRHLAAQALVFQARQAARYGLDTLTDELYHLLDCPALTAIEKSSIAMLAPPDSKLEALTLIGSYYVKVLKRNGKLNEN